jgi:hypothetical protein
MAEDDSAGVDRFDDEDEVLAAIMAQSRDSYLKEQHSILRSIQQLSIGEGAEERIKTIDSCSNSIDARNHDYDDAAWTRRHQDCSTSNSSCDSNRNRGDDRKMPCKKDRCSDTSTQDPWCSTSTMNTSPTTATEFSNEDVIQEQIRILQEIQATSGQTLHLCDGSLVHVRGMKQTFSSIAQGDAVLTACTACGTISQVPTQARALYCTVCGEISPVVPMKDVELARLIHRREKECHGER